MVSVLIRKTENNEKLKHREDRRYNYPGVTRNMEGFWIARFTFEKKQRYIGSFKTEEEAINFLKEFKKKFAEDQNLAENFLRKFKKNDRKS